MTPEMKQIPSYAAAVTPLMLSQYRRALRLLGLVGAGCSAADSVEQALFEIRDGFWVRSAVGAQLDVLGRVYGVSRGGMDDPTFRAQLQFRAGTLVSGNPEEILTFLAFVAGDVGLEYIPEYPAGFVIGISTLVGDQAMLESLAPAGVHIGYGNPMQDYYGNPMETQAGVSMYALVG